VRTRNIYLLLGYACVLVACTKSSDGANGAAGNGGRGGSSVAGSQAGSGAGGKSGAGGTGSGAGGAAGAAGSHGCPSGIAIPTLCRVCADGSCGTASCSSGKFTGFVCPDDADGGAAGSAGSSSGGACNLACVKGTHCLVNPTPMCVEDANDAGADAGSSGALHWVVSCGSPVCQGAGLYDDPKIPNCTTEKEGQTCTTEGQRCDGVASCGATLLCATKPPQTCPISRARFKQEIRYLDDAERDQFHDQITQLRLASYRYKSAPDVPQLGFMIDDVEPSVAVAGDHVNLYAYLSMAVAAIQVQDRQIKLLRRELEQLRATDCQVPLRCDQQ
jgi:hypothetical protein